MRVDWTPRASASFDALVSRLDELSAGAGRRLVDRVTERLSQLEAFPDSGRIVPEFEERLFRELVEGDYRIVYERFPDRVEVIAVVHGSRSLIDP